MACIPQALRYIGLNKNQIGDGGAAVLAAALGKARSAVTTLKLDGNDVGDACRCRGLKPSDYPPCR